MLKRFLVTIIGIPLLFAVLILGNKYVLDVIVAILALISIHEYMKCFKEKFKPISWLGYFLACFIAFIHIVPREYIVNYLGFAVILISTILFMHVVFTEMKINIVDIAITFFGIIYIVGFFSFTTLLFGYERNGENLGKFYIWYLFLTTWGSDILAYIVGCKFGKHTFSKISPKKTIEGCVAGAIAGIILTLIATFIFNNYFGMNVNYILIGIIGLILAIIGQIGDFSASCIKRYTGVKDFSNLLPGHGGIIDRFDSVIFAAPFAYYLITLLI